jgi:hypothetical protein
VREGLLLGNGSATLGMSEECSARFGETQTVAAAIFVRTLPNEEPPLFEISQELAENRLLNANVRSNLDLSELARIGGHAQEDVLPRRDGEGPKRFLEGVEDGGGVEL